MYQQYYEIKFRYTDYLGEETQVQEEVIMSSKWHCHSVVEVDKARRNEKCELTSWISFRDCRTKGVSMRTRPNQQAARQMTTARVSVVPKTLTIS